VSENMVDEISKFKKEIKFIYEEMNRPYYKSNAKNDPCGAKLEQFYHTAYNDMEVRPLSFPLCLLFPCMSRGMHVHVRACLVTRAAYMACTCLEVVVRRGCKMWRHQVQHVTSHVQTYQERHMAWHAPVLRHRQRRQERHDQDHVKRHKKMTKSKHPTAQPTTRHKHKRCC
jgi:hypothetical protein